MAGVTRRQAVLAGLGGIAATLPTWAAGVPAVLSQAALLTPKALGAATLAVARAGDRLVAVGERGTVLLSDDHGASWRQAQVPVQATLTAVSFADARTGWAAGHLGVILRSDDGGATWQKQLDGVQAAELVKQAAQRSGDDAAMAQAQRLVEEGADKPFFDLEFIDAQRGFAVGAYNLMFATMDGGKNWTALGPRLPNAKNLHLYGVRARGRTLVIAGEQGLLLRSTDGGASFSALASPYKGSFSACCKPAAARWWPTACAGRRIAPPMKACTGTSWTPACPWRSGPAWLCRTWAGWPRRGCGSTPASRT
jgi:photosystem II stability/assembly factor-like uncharacterized protein